MPPEGRTKRRAFTMPAGFVRVGASDEGVVVDFVNRVLAGLIALMISQEFPAGGPHPLKVTEVSFSLDVTKRRLIHNVVMDEDFADSAVIIVTGQGKDFESVAVI